MSTVSPTTSSYQRVVLHNVDWKEYTRLLWAFAEQRSVRLTYDRGVLEIMAPLYRHDNSSRFLGRLVVALTEELNLPIASGGTTTLRRRRRRRGLEPDECFWIANEARVRGRQRLNLRTDPPPDLAIEVDVTRSSLDRMSIYAQLAVPEVWRLDVPALTFHVLQVNGDYVPSATSRSFPWLTAADIVGFLALLGQDEENAILRQFRAWIRQRQGGAGTGATQMP
jgi:Uma2 family endonuclease